MDAIQVGSPVRVDWPDARWNSLHGKVGVVVKKGGRMVYRGVADRLWHVKVDGDDRLQVLGQRHLRLIRADLEPYVHSSRFALTGDDVVHDHLGKRRY